MTFEENIQIKIAMSMDKLPIIILWPSIWEIKSPSLTHTLGQRHGFLQNIKMSNFKNNLRHSY